MMKQEQYRPMILKFTSNKVYENPFLDCSIRATFVGPNHETIVREAYWDGDQTYAISFAPISLGTWIYTIEADEETGCNQFTGELECVPYTGDLELYQHGFIKVSEDHRYFTYADGTPFFWLGDTHWEYCYGEKWEESNHPMMDSMCKGMVDRRVSQGYTVYQTNLRSDAIMGGDACYWKDGLPNIEFYQNELDRRMYYLADQGIVNALGLAWFMSIKDNVEHYQQLTRYLIARYGALPIVWTLAGEVAGYDPFQQQFYIDEWRKIALYIQEHDSYHHLQTAHYTNERPFATYYQDEEWMDFTLNQAGHGDYVIGVSDYKAFLSTHNDKPFVEGEAFYEYCSTLEENGTRLCTPAMLRRVAYLTIQAGGCGYTYGAQGIWDNVWEKGQANTMGIFNRFDITWYEAIDGPGGAQMGYMKAFYMKERFWELFPYVTGSDTINDPFGKKMPLITVSKDRSHWVLYYPEATRKSGVLEGFHNATYMMQWFDPVTGTYDETITEIAITDHTWNIPVKPNEHDWCLVLKEKKEV